MSHIGKGHPNDIVRYQSSSDMRAVTALKDASDECNIDRYSHFMVVQCSSTVIQVELEKAHLHRDYDLYECSTGCAKKQK